MLVYLLIYHGVFNGRCSLFPIEWKEMLMKKIYDNSLSIIYLLLQIQNLLI